MYSQVMCLMVGFYYGVFIFNIVFLHTYLRKLCGLKEIQGSRVTPISGKYLGIHLASGIQIYGLNIFCDKFVLS